jgi:hypothetical protein
MIDMTGTKFGKLTAIEYRGSGLWLFRCDCGNEKVISGYDARRGRTRSCGCLLKELIRNKNIANKPIGESAKNHVYLHYVHDAISRGHEFNLSPEFVREITQKPCFYCGSLHGNIMRNRFGRGDIAYTGIDRVDSSMGYTEDNVVPCCKHCNSAKGKRTTEDFLSWIHVVYNNFYLKNAVE